MTNYRHFKVDFLVIIFLIRSKYAIGMVYVGHSR